MSPKEVQMGFNVKGGTVKHGGPSLCESCQNATIVKGQTLDEEIVLCSEMNYKPVRFKVTECSDYEKHNTMKLWQMVQMAWPLATKKGKIIGFMSPEEARRRKDEIDEIRDVDD